ncbi:MAG: ParB N-terminal domain-containing protein [Oscillospiraceae bacterium]|nr:ParB N-terminal domain-containing protein [Oscillospiraceae bacterium]
MNITMIPLAELTPNSRNVRIHSAKQMEEYKRSVKQFGQTKAIVCDENKVILIGNGLYEAMKALGETEAACFIKTGLSEHDKLKMMMADNKIYSLGVDNLQTIEDIIAELGEVKDFDIPGYDADLLETLTFAPIEADDFMGGYGLIGSSAKADMAKASEKYAQEEAEFASEAEEIIPQGRFRPQEDGSTVFSPPTDIDAGFPEKAEETQGNALQRRFIVCPKCGEKIWL